MGENVEGGAKPQTTNKPEQKVRYGADWSQKMAEAAEVRVAQDPDAPENEKLVEGLGNYKRKQETRANNIWDQNQRKLDAQKIDDGEVVQLIDDWMKKHGVTPEELADVVIQRVSTEQDKRKSKIAGDVSTAQPDRDSRRKLLDPVPEPTLPFTFVPKKISVDSAKPPIVLGPVKFTPGQNLSRGK